MEGLVVFKLSSVRGLRSECPGKVGMPIVVSDKKINFNAIA